MRLLIDECVHGAVARHLEAAGVDVIWAARIMAGAPDHKVLALAHSENRVVITDDRDYGRLVFKESLASIGVVYLRVVVSDDTVAEALATAILALPGGGAASFTTIDEGGVRTRPLP